MTDESIVGRFGSGREVRRIEDAELLVGAGRFVDDISLPSQAHIRRRCGEWVKSTKAVIRDRS